MDTDGVQTAHAVHRNAERVAEGRSTGHPHPQPGEGARTAADDDRVELRDSDTGIGHGTEHVGRELLGVGPGIQRHPFGEGTHGAVLGAVDHAGGDRRGRGVDGQDVHGALHCQITVRVSVSVSRSMRMSR